MQPKTERFNPSLLSGIREVDLLYLLLEAAEKMEVPWAAWRKGNRLMMVIGGALKVYEPKRPLEGCEELSKGRIYERIGDAENSDFIALNHAAPIRLVLRRFSSFDKGKTESDPWDGWLNEGSIWSPDISIVYEEENGYGVIVKRMSGLADLLLSLLTEKTKAIRSIKETNRRETDGGELSSLEGFESWKERVERARSKMLSGELSKVVFARSWVRKAPAGMSWSAVALWRRCLDDSHGEEIPFALSPSGKACFVGVSPERLFELNQGELMTHALAGTRVAEANDVRSKEIAEELSSSTKDIHEHEIVVDQIKAQIEPLCTSLRCEPRRVKRARSLLHLETPIRAKLRAESTAQSLMECLHPTPALGGAPTDQALEIIHGDEPMSRGGYASPWMWESIGGEACAVIGIRSALLNGSMATLYAGAGIVSNSDPDSEWRETRAKAEVMNALLTEETLRTQYCDDQESVTVRQQRRCLRLVEQLKEAGVRGAVISPGSRNTPLALALDHLLPTIVSVDERSAGFTALGWAKASEGAVALCCTSGSALAHYLPALVEARYSAVPIVVLSADRPPRLRGCGAPQTIEQSAIFGTYCRGWIEPPCDALGKISQQRAEVLDELWCKAAGSMTRLALRDGFRGAVHLNLPFEEPLWSAESESCVIHWPKPQEGLYKEHRGSQDLDPKKLILCAKLERSLKLNHGIIYCGPLSPSAALLLAQPLSQLSELTGWPIFAEGSSQLRGRIPTINCLEEMTRSGDVPSGESLEMIITVGLHTHSRAVRKWFESATKAHFYWIGEGEERIDPQGLGVERIGESLTEGIAILRAMTATLSRDHDESNQSINRAWAHRWSQVASALRAESVEDLDDQRLWGGAVGSELSRALEEFRFRARDHLEYPNAHRCADVVVASSMAFRDHDMTWSPKLERAHEQGPAYCWVNRGANGIDGTLSTALGVALASSREAVSPPLVVWLGDLAAHHDLQGLHRLSQWAKHSRRAVIVMITNNQGGGIFYHLPMKETARFIPLFVTPLEEENHKNSSPWEGVSAWIAATSYQRVSERQALRCALDEGLLAEGLSLIEVVYHAQFDTERHQNYWMNAKALIEKADEKGVMR